MAARKKTPAKLNDGYANVLSGTQTPRDKASGGFYTFDLNNPEQTYAAYQSSWLAAKTVDVPAEDATRKWRSWIAEADQIEKIEALEKKLKLKTRLNEALIAARLWGGAAIYINTQDRDQSSVLTPGREIKSLVVLTRNELTPDQIVRDINSEYYGRPEYYQLQTAGAEQVRIHASRLAVFSGRLRPAGTTFSGFDAWGMSVLSSAMTAIKQLDSVMANINSLVFEAKINVFKFKGWAEMLADSSNDAMLSRRLSLQATHKGLHGDVVIDSEDEFLNRTASFSSLPEIITKFGEQYSGATGIPYTRVYGRAAAGLSGSGEGDERTYYDSINVMQTSNGEAMALLDECLIYQALGSRPQEVYYEWRPLRQLTESERAEIFSKTATALRALAGTASGPVVPLDALSDAAVNEFIEQGMLPGLQAAIEKYGSMSEQEDLPPDDKPSEPTKIIADAAPAPLYVSRKVTNAAEILKHYEDQGVKNLIDPSKMHVTITYSRDPVQWLKMGEAWEDELSVKAGGARVTESFGENKDTLVLSFASSSLSWRHEQMKQEGASWDWPEYQPHLSVSYGFSGDVDKITPWQGEIKFGPEIFEALDTEWSA